MQHKTALWREPGERGGIASKGLPKHFKEQGSASYSRGTNGGEGSQGERKALQKSNPTVLRGAKKTNLLYLLVN